jgi:group I intron endonuclease
MLGKIYLIRNRINGKGYVGQTIKSLRIRFNEHKYKAKQGSNCALHKAIRKHGVENFEIKEVVSCETVLLDDLEKHYIKFYGTYAPAGHGYNLTEGGDGGFDGRVIPKESLARMSEVHKGNSYAKGYKHTDEAKLAMSVAKKGKAPYPMTEATKAKISATLKGHTVSQKTRNKISEIQKGKPQPRLKGRKKGPRSAETKAKISATMKKLRAEQRKERTKQKTVV